MSFNELNSVENTIIQKPSGVNLNAAAPTSSVQKDDAAGFRSFPWKYRSAEALNLEITDDADGRRWTQIKYIRNNELIVVSRSPAR